MNPDLPERWTELFEQARSQSLSLNRVRKARSVTSREGVMCEVDGERVVNFCGNDYLGLGARASSVALDGAGSAHMVAGHFAEHEALLAELCDWLGAEDAILCGNGFVGNLAALGTLIGANDLCVQDRLNHASMIDALRATPKSLARYPHNDVDGARQQLQRDAALKLLATDSVFSMDGDIAPLDALRELCTSQNALLYVDEAHSIGVLGASGEGLAPFADLRLVTFGKALGSFGAALVGRREIVEHLRQFARPLLFTTALPPSVAAHVHAHIREIRRGELTARLAENRSYFAGLNVPGVVGGESAIFVRLIGDDGDALGMSSRLFNQGLWVSAIRPPTVAEGSARLRMTLSALHTRAQIDQLADALR